MVCHKLTIENHFLTKTARKTTKNCGKFIIIKEKQGKKNWYQGVFGKSYALTSKTSLVFPDPHMKASKGWIKAFRKCSWTNGWSADVYP